MSLLRRLALYLGREVARNPDVRSQAESILRKSKRVLNEDVKPLAKRAWNEMQPEVEEVKREIGRVAQELRDEYRNKRNRDSS